MHGEKKNVRLRLYLKQKLFVGKKKKKQPLFSPCTTISLWFIVKVNRLLDMNWAVGAAGKRRQKNRGTY